MNESVVLWPKLDLARERPFDMAGTEVRPSALEVETDGKVITLEPQVMKVLVALHRGRGRPVSRDELIDICWGGRIVTEAALNRCVARLRKALAANPHIRLDTIATVGYRLQTSSETARPAMPAAPTAPTAPGTATRTRWILALLAALGLAAVALFVAFQLPRPMTWTVAAYRPLTTEPGMETHPAISPGGQQLVYSQRLDSSVGRDLYLRDVDQGIPVRNTTSPDDDHSAAWSPAGDRIAFVRTAPDAPCTLLIAPMPAGAERVATRCQSARYTRVAWRDPTTLVFWDRPSRATPWRIRTVDLTTGVAADLTSPPNSTLGDVDPTVSPDGRYLVFRRGLLRGADDLFLKDLKTGRERALTTDGFRAAGHVWSSDSRHIFYSSNRDGEFGLWTIDTARRDPPKRVSLGAGQFTFSRMSIDRRNRLAVEAPRIRTNITAMAPGGALTPVTRTSSDDWAPRVAADGTVAYISNRSGAYELWIAKPDGQPVRLTNIVGYVHSPAWSPDGRMLSFVAARGRRAEIYTINRDGSQLRTVTTDGLDKMDPAWTPAGDALIYLQRTGAHYRLVRIDLASGARPREIAAGRDWRQLRQGPGGRLFGLPLLDDTVEAMDGRPVPNVRISDIDTWAVGRDGIYVLTGRGRAPPTAWLYPWTGPPRRLGEMFSGGDIGVGPDGRVLISQSFNEQVDLGLFDLSAR